MALFEFDEEELEEAGEASIDERVESIERRIRRIEAALASANIDASIRELVQSMPEYERDTHVSVSAGSSYRMTIPRELGESYELKGTDRVAIRDISSQTGERAFVVKVID